MAKFLESLVLAALLVSCASSPVSAPQGEVRYRYENSLDLRRDNTLNHVVVVGYDSSNMKETTSLVVSAGGAPITLKNMLDPNGAMYAPSVDLTKDGNLSIRWGVIDDRSETVVLAADRAGGLTVVKRTSQP